MYQSDGGANVASSRDIERVAADWLAQAEAGRLDAAGHAEFERWLQSATAHRVAYVRLRAAWRESARLKAIGAGVPSGQVPSRGAWRAAAWWATSGGAAESDPAHSGAGRPGAPVSRTDKPARVRPQPRPHTRRVWVAAAAVVLACVCGLVLHALHHDPGDRLATQIGVIESRPLADGSTMTLGTDTQVQVRMSERERLVQLQRGEAFFDVAKDPARPFVVQAGDQRVVAVGTKFSVRREDAGVRVLVLEGRVRMEPVATPPHAGPAPVLAAGGFALTGAQGALVQGEDPGQVERATRWRSGYLAFDHTTLADAVAEFNRYNLRRIVLEDAELARIEVTGNFRWSNADAFVRLLEAGYGVRATRGDGEIVLSRR